jgi:aromatic ring-cleaving dioxygenase
MTGNDAPYHAHVYYSDSERASAVELRDALVRRSADGSEPRILFAGAPADGGAGPHPIGQFELHFRESSLAAMIAALEGSGLSVLVHPLTDDDMADHTRLALWIGEPVPLDLDVLDPPGLNQGLARFGKSDF